MQPSFNIENLITFLKGKKKVLFLVSFLFSLVYSSFRIYTKLNKYETQVKFYVTNSEAVDYKSILDKGFIDISGENRDLLRLQSFGYSNQLLNLVLDSIKNNEEEFLKTIKLKGNLIAYVSKLYTVNISELGELEVLVSHEDEAFSYYLCHKIMEGINTMNNTFLSEFKNDQIEASLRQLKLLNTEKKLVLNKISKLSKKINEADLKTIENLGKEHYDQLEIQEFLLNINNPEKLELKLSFQKIQNLDNNIETFNTTLYNDRWSLEMLKKKKPFVTQDKPASRKSGFLNITILFLTSFFSFFFVLLLTYSLSFRYQKIIKLLFS